MNFTIILLLSAFTAVIAGIFIGRLIYSSKFSGIRIGLEEKLNSLSVQYAMLKEQSNLERSLSDKNLQQINSELKTIRGERETLAIMLTKKERDFENLLERTHEQKQDIEKLQEKFTKEFENLANKIMEEKSVKFTEQNRENIKNILSPLQEKIQLFEKKVEDTHKESIDYHAALRQQILGLRDMNEQMSRETLNLTRALKG